MKTDITITLYSISRCGYYSHGTESALFCRPPSTFNQLRDWSANKQINQTKVYDSGDDADELPTYIHGIEEQGGNFLISVWNETPSSAGATSSTKANATVGSPIVFSNQIEPGSIPGYPTYFWVMPDKHLVATLRFESRVTGVTAFQRYLQAFLTVSTKHVVVKPNHSNGQLIINGYRKNPNDAPLNLSPRFKLSIKRNSGDHGLIISRHQDIRRIVRNVVVTTMNTASRRVWQKSLDLLGLTSSRGDPNKLSIKHELSVKPTETEVKNIIDHWKENTDTEDFGFMFKGEQQTHWLSNALARAQWTFDIPPEDDKRMVGKFLSQLVSSKGDILSSL